MKEPAALPPPPRLDADGIPILEEEIADTLLDTLAAELKDQLFTELDPLIQDVARVAFGIAVRQVALDFQRAFEQELGRLLAARLRNTMETKIDRA